MEIIAGLLLLFSAGFTAFHFVRFGARQMFKALKIKIIREEHEKLA